MAVDRPDIASVWRAIEIYLPIAYGHAPPPAAVQSRISSLRSLEAGAFFDSPLLEKTNPQAPARFMLRLGNRFYPHMKLSIDRRPDGRGWLFRADTHDEHCCPPPDSPEYSTFQTLMEKNQKLAQTIETAWAEAGLPTFKTWLQEDLARRGGTSRQ